MCAAFLDPCSRRRHQRKTARLVAAHLRHPGAIAGAAFESTIEDHLGDPILIGVNSIVFALLLGWADRARSTLEVDDFHIREAGVMGIAQALALAPGVSPLNLANVFVNDFDAGFQATNGQVTVTGKLVSEPATLTLLGLGLGAALGLRLRWRRAGRP
jgi:hypothetical protein